MGYGKTFKLKDGNTAKITGVYALGVHYHTLNSMGDCIAGEKYVTHSELTLLLQGEYEPTS